MSKEVMYEIRLSNRFKKQVQRCAKRGLDLTLLESAIDILSKEGVLPASFRPHKLTGNYAGCWECHLRPDWLLVWEQNDEQFTLLFVGTGTHADLF